MRFVNNSGRWTQIPDSWKGPLYPVIDGDPSTGIFTPIINRLGDWTTTKLDGLIAVLNANSAEIITGGILVCAFGVMLSPLIDMAPAKWYGRMFTVLWLGIIWRVVLI